jgi:anhydro-N-acetylmuramic acid kinase
MADIAAGGQGAPLVPAFHQFAFQTPIEDRFIVNIGGIANITFLPCERQDDIIGFDTGPGNTLLDEWITQHKGKTFDENGAWASSGQIIPEMLTSMMQDAYIQKSLPKSTGKEHFNLAWLARHTNTLDQTKAEDIQRTLLEFTACGISAGVKQLMQTKGISNAQLYICGGGINNSALLQSLQNQLPEIGISSTEQLGIHPQLVECSAFAWLAHQTMQSKPGNLPSVTGASQKRILGGIYLN